MYVCSYPYNEPYRSHIFIWNDRPEVWHVMLEKTFPADVVKRIPQENTLDSVVLERKIGTHNFFIYDIDLQRKATFVLHGYTNDRRLPEQCRKFERPINALPITVSISSLLPRNCPLYS